MTIATATELTWETLIALEPRLGVLLRDIEAARRHVGRRHHRCANALWYGYGVYRGVGFKERLCTLIGWERWSSGGDPRLRTPEAYELAYRRLYAALPDCRNCGCLDRGDFRPR